MDNNSRHMENIKKAVQKGDTASLLSSLSPEDLKVLSALMKDKASRDKLLSSPEAKAIISKFLGG
ncbi:MAG: hypothetical protein UIG59_03500 [Acutalibacteraceae bacterium]|nr:hypothetical protein [Acutalibacteraceae bacterium]